MSVKDVFILGVVIGGEQHKVHFKLIPLIECQVSADLMPIVPLTLSQLQLSPCDLSKCKEF